MIPRILKSLRFGLPTALALATLVAAFATFLDWRENPSGIFQTPTDGTQWSIVFDTFSSWFWPTALPVFLFATTAHFTMTSIRSRRQS